MPLKCFWPVYHFTKGEKIAEFKQQEMLIGLKAWGGTNVKDYKANDKYTAADNASHDFLICCDKDKLDSFNTPNACKRIYQFLFPEPTNATSEIRDFLSKKMIRALQDAIGIGNHAGENVMMYRLDKITFQDLDTPDSRRRCEYCEAEKDGNELKKFNDIKDEFWSLFCDGPTPDVPSSPAIAAPPLSTPVVPPVPPPKPKVEIKKIPLTQIDDVVDPCNKKIEKIIIESADNEDIRFLIDIETLKSELSKKIIDSKDLLNNISKQVFDSDGVIKNLNFKTLTEEYLKKTSIAERKFYSFPENEKIELPEDDPAKKVLLADTIDLDKIIFPNNKSPTAEKGDLPLEVAQTISIILKDADPKKKYNSGPKRLIFSKKVLDYSLQLFNGEQHGKTNTFYEIKLNNNFFVTIPIKFSISIRPRVEGLLSFTLKCKNKDKDIVEGDSCWTAYNNFTEKTKTLQFVQPSISLTFIDLSTNISLQYNLDKDTQEAYIFPKDNLIGPPPKPFNSTNKAGDKKPDGSSIPIGLYLFPPGTPENKLNEVINYLKTNKIFYEIIENTTTKYKSIILKGGNDANAIAIAGIDPHPGSKIRTFTDIKGTYITDFTNGSETIIKQIETNFKNINYFTLSLKNDKIIIFDNQDKDELDKSVFVQTGEDNNTVTNIKEIIGQKITIPGMDPCCCCKYELDPIQNNIKASFDIIFPK